MKIFVRILLQVIWILLLGTTVYADVRDELKGCQQRDKEEAAASEADQKG